MIKKRIILLVLFVFSLSFFVSCELFKDPNNTEDKTKEEEFYDFAKASGYNGSYDDWIESIKGVGIKNASIENNKLIITLTDDSVIDAGNLNSGSNGKNAYELACDAGFTGSVIEWLDSLKSDSIGKSAYDLACDNGFNGTIDEWLESLNGRDGKSAYDIACSKGFNGTVNDWLNSLKRY